jgi:hypothetical protein
MISLHRFAAIVLLGALSFACETDVSDVYTPQEWRQIFQDQGWTALPFPDSKYEPGAIIKVTEEGGIRYIDHLRSCGYPDDVLEPEIGKIPGITFSKARELDADAVLNIQGITAGPEFSKLSKTRLSVSEHSADALRLIKLQIWEETPGNLDGAARTCKEALQRPDYYLITESFKVSKGGYTLLDKTGAKLKVSLPELGRILKFEPNVKYEVTSEGELMIEEPVYYAVHRAVSTAHGFDVLGTGAEAPSTADAQIDALYQETAENP